MKRFFITLAIIATASFAFSCDKAQDEFLEGITTYPSNTIAEFIALGTSKDYHAIKGTIKSVTSEQYSQFVLEDITGSVSVYGLWDCEDGDRILNMGSYKVGDVISIAAKASTFKGKVEAKNAFPYDPSNVAIWASKISCSFTAEGGEESISVHAKSDVKINIVDNWVSAEYDESSNKLDIKVQSSKNTSERSTKVELVCNDQRVKITVKQYAYVPPTVSIVEAVNHFENATVEGVISVLLDDGFILSDRTGSIFVNYEDADCTGLVDVGISFEVSGEIFTENYITGIKATSIKALGKSESELSSPKQCALNDFDKMESDLASADPTKPNAHTLEYVEFDGILNPGTGSYFIEDFDNGALMVKLDNLDGFDLEALNLVYTTVRGFIAGYADATVTVVPLSIEKKVMDSAITIDGSFSDWASITGYKQDSSNNIYELKLYTIGTDIYIYAKMRADAYTEFGTLKYFIQIYFNTDNDNTTGPTAWVFKGLDSSGYIRMTNGKDGLWKGTDGDGSCFYDFVFTNPDATFVSANKLKFDGEFTSINGSYPCGGEIEGEVAEFEWMFSMGTLHLPRHQSVGVGVRFVHEGCDDPYRPQANYLIPTDGWWSYEIK